MLRTLKLLLGSMTKILCSRRNLLLENLALRQQLAVLKQKHPRRYIAAPDRLFWIVLQRFWPGWKKALIIVRPDTVIRWHRAGFKLYWKWLSRHRARPGRKPTTKHLRELIFRMVAENPTWGAPRIHGELRMLGFDISERTVLRWMRIALRNPEPAKRWAAFLSNHREAIAAMDCCNHAVAPAARVDNIAGTILFSTAALPSVMSKGEASVHTMMEVKKVSDSRLLWSAFLRK